MKKPSPQQLWENQLAGLWPCAKGSLAKVCKPCIRPNCRRCRAGQKHPAWLLAYSQAGKRHCRYVPLALVPTLKQALKNGRQIEKLLARQGQALLLAHRQTRKTKPKSSSKS